MTPRDLCILGVCFILPYLVFQPTSICIRTHVNKNPIKDVYYLQFSSLDQFWSQSKVCRLGRVYTLEKQSTNMVRKVRHHSTTSTGTHLTWDQKKAKHMKQERNTYGLQVRLTLRDTCQHTTDCGLAKQYTESSRPDDIVLRNLIQ